MENTDVRKCAYCKSMKPWIWNGKKLKDGSKVYVNDTGTRWAGRRCPECERSRVAAAVRCDNFERDLIIKQLENSGYNLESRTLPFKVEKDGQRLTVGIKRAFTDNGKIVLEGQADKSADLQVLVFESVRLCTTEQIEKMGSAITYYD